jgi:flagellar biogenesis protein FliO
MMEVFDAGWTLVSALAIIAILGWIIRYFLKKR